jgi:Ice-binding-like
MSEPGASLRKNTPMKYKYLLLLAIVGLQAPATAQRFSLGTAQSFAVMGGSTVTNTGPSVIGGDLGLSPGSAVTGFLPGIVTPPATIHIADSVALQAQNDVATSYTSLAGLALTQDLTGQDLGGLTLTPGVYHFSSSAQLTGALTLNALGNADALFVFQIGSTLTTASSSSVMVINGGDGCNIFWQVGSSATLGTTTNFEGNILADQSITLNTGANITDGRVLAQNGAVTLDTNNISIARCPFVSGPAGTFGTAAAVPELSSLLGFGSFLALGGLAILRQRNTARKAA